MCLKPFCAVHLFTTKRKGSAEVSLSFSSGCSKSSTEPRVS